MSEPKLEQSQRILESLSLIAGIHLVTEWKLLDQTLNSANHMEHILLAKHLLVGGRMGWQLLDLPCCLWGEVIEYVCLVAALLILRVLCEFLIQDLAIVDACLIVHQWVEVPCFLVLWIHSGCLLTVLNYHLVITLIHSGLIELLLVIVPLA